MKDRTRLDDTFSFSVDLCDDDETWVWTLWHDNERYSDGYEPNKEEAAKKARQAWQEEKEWAKTP